MLEGWGGSREMFISYPKIVWHKYQKYRIQHFFVTFFFFFLLQCRRSVWEDCLAKTVGQRIVQS